MKKKKHPISNIQHPTPIEEHESAWECHDGSTRAGNHIAGQILRSGTSPYPNHGEAEDAESRDDFIHKLKICLKELRETRRWARLISRKSWVKENATLVFVLGEAEELIRIFFASVQTAKKNALAEKHHSSQDRRYPSGKAG